MEHIKRPSITRLARRAAIKSLSGDCFPVIHKAIGNEIKDIISAALVINSEHTTKTLMVEDVARCFRGSGL